MSFTVTGEFMCNLLCSLSTLEEVSLIDWDRAGSDTVTSAEGWLSHAHSARQVPWSHAPGPSLKDSSQVLYH